MPKGLTTTSIKVKKIQPSSMQYHLVQWYCQGPTEARVGQSGPPPEICLDISVDGGVSGGQWEGVRKATKGGAASRWTGLPGPLIVLVLVIRRGDRRWSCLGMDGNLRKTFVPFRWHVHWSA